uniref:PA domain-containing protein n=1 Tax=Alexandrium monilatum TaxID=311494 RepID=A0A7S4R077_9DINO
MAPAGAGRMLGALALLSTLPGTAAEDVLRRRPPTAEQPRIAVVRVLSPPALADTREGVLATFSQVPVAGKELAATTPEDDPLGCQPYPSRSIVSADDQPRVAVVRRGNCSYVLKAQLAQAAGAEGVVVVSDNESLVAMGGESADPKVSIFAVNVQRSVGDQILSQLSSGASGGPVRMSFELYVKGILDFSEALLVLFATSCVATGALVSTSDLRAGSPFAPQQGERIMEIDSKMAVGMCLFGSLALVVFYFLMKYLIYFIIFGFALGSVVNFIEIGSLSLQYFAPSMRGRVLQVGPVAVRTADIAAAVPSIAIGIAWLVMKDGPGPLGWILQDVMGFGFLCWIQRAIRLPNLKVATLLLSVMFFFDIFWVFISPIFFGNSVMVKVATGGGPGQTVPLLFRIPAFGDPFHAERMLGFGDIAIPGLLVSFTRRHDTLSRRRFWEGYFGPAVLGYLVGLCATIASLILMQKAQPALLYLVPGTLGTTLVLGSMRKELSHLWHAVPAAGGAGLQAGLTEIAALVNDEGFCVRLGAAEGFQDRFYCSRFLGTEVIPDSDGRCGPDDGPQCPSCARFQTTRQASAAVAGSFTSGGP